jgi:hypothetical protein
MRRWIRIAFNTVTAISLVLALLVAGLWVRSYWIADWFIVGDVGVLDRGMMLWSAEGSVVCSLVNKESPGDPIGRMPFWVTYTPGPKMSPWRTQRSTYSRDELIGAFGFSVSSVPRRQAPFQSSVRETLLVPDWMSCTALLVLPVSKTRSLARRCWGRHKGRCPTCGYDLRATPDRCPECGTAKAP